MKRLTRGLLPLLLALCLGIACAGCSGSFDASGYVDATLRNIYLDDSSAYVELVETTAEEAHESYLEGIETEVQFFYNYMSFESDYVSEETHQRVLELYKQIYSHTKFEVEEANKAGDGYTVVVRIYPIDIFETAGDELDAYVTMFVEKVQNGDYNDVTDEELEAAYQDGLLSILEQKTASIGHLDPIEQTVQIKQDTDKLWGMSDEDFQNLDQHIIRY